MSDEREHFLRQLTNYEDLVGNIRALVGKTNTELLEAVRQTVQELRDAEGQCREFKKEQPKFVQNEQFRRDLAMARRILVATSDETTAEAACRVQDARELAETQRNEARRQASALRSEIGWADPGGPKFWQFSWE